jgi:hypothetical protein
MIAPRCIPALGLTAGLRASRRSTLVTSLLVLGSLVTGTAAGLPQKSAANIEADLAFARGLASKWSFVDLAEEVIREVESSRLESDQAASLALLRCEVYAVGARNEPDPARRNALFEQALGCFDSYITQNAHAPNRGDAEEAFVAASQVYARSLQIAIDDAIGDEAKALTEKRIDVLTQGVKRTTELVEAISAIPVEERTEKQVGQRMELMLNRGQMYATISAAQKDDPFFREQAIKVLEDLVFEANPGTPYALRAYTALGDVYVAAGDHETATGYYDGVADDVIPFDPERREADLEWSKLATQGKQRRFLFVELAVPGILRTYQAIGDTTTAVQRALYFWNLQRADALELSQFGQEAMLAVARTMLDSEGHLGGDVAAGQAEWFATADEAAAKYRQARLRMTTAQFARQVANQVADDAQSNALKIAAGRLLTEIAKRPGQSITLGELYNAANAKFREEDYVAARQAVSEMLGRMDGLEAAERVEYGAKIYYLLGETLRKEGRELEAAMAYREGAVNWSDPEFDEKNAKGFQFLITRITKAASDDPDLKALASEAENVIASKGSKDSAETVMFNRGKRAEAAGKWTEAIESYQQVTEEALDYELAYVNIGVCLFRNNQVSEALKRFDTYLNEVRVDPKRVTESPSALAKRKGASAVAEFYRGFIGHLVAENRYKTSGNTDTSGFAKVLEHFAGFEERYSDQPSLCAMALNRTVDSLAKLGRSDEAQKKLDLMVERFPDDKQTGIAAVSLFNTLKARLAERTASNAEQTELDQIKRDTARTLGVSNRISASPAYQNLLQEAELWAEIADWANAKEVYARIVSRFSEDEERKSSVARSITPTLAFCMLQLRELNDAKELLTPLIQGDSPTKSAVQYYSMAIVGWLEGGAAGVTVVPGAGGTEAEFTYVTEKLTSIQKSGGPKWANCEWYEDMLAQIYAYYVWGQSDDRKKDSAKNMMDGTQPFLEGDTTFAAVDQFCTTDEETPAELKARLGHGTLRARYQWLWSKTR